MSPYQRIYSNGSHRSMITIMRICKPGPDRRCMRIAIDIDLDRHDRDVTTPLCLFFGMRTTFCGSQGCL